MALISKIRNNSWLLVVVIGLGLGSFILMDMTGSANRVSAGDMTVGVVNGQGIEYKEFQNTEQILYSGGGNTFANRSFLWNYFVEKTIADQYAEKLGLGVSRDELMELQFGNNLSPIIQQRFVNQNTGQVDRTALNNMRSRIESDQLEPQQEAFWRVQEKEIVTGRIQSKLNNMVTKGIYTPSWMAEMRNAEQKATVDAEYVKIPLTSIADSDVTVSEADMQNFLNENRGLYVQTEESRVAEYVTFDIKATKQDSMDIREKLNDMKAELQKAENDSLYVVNHNGLYDVAYFKESQLPPALKDTIFSFAAGDTYGPYLENGQYKVIKVLDKKVMADSVKSRHILRQVKTQEEFIVANALIDSLITAIKAGSTDFAAAATRFGTDATRTKGGDLGYAAPGSMVKPFNDMIFYQAKVGELNKVITQFGIHLVEVTDRKVVNKDMGVKYSTLFENIMPSTETQTVEYDRIFDFLSENSTMEELRAALPGVGKSLTSTPLLKQNDYTFPEIGQSPTSRELIRWIFTPGVKEGTASPEVYVHKDPTLYFNSKLVLVGLKEINEGDMPSVAALRGTIEPLVRNKMKAAKIASNLKGVGMSAAAAQYNTEVMPLTGVGMASGSIAGLGKELNLVGEMFKLAPGEEAGPIIGSDGVFYVKVNNKNEAPQVMDITASKKLYSSLSKSQVRTKLWEALKSENEIEDRRYIYY